MTRAVGDFKKAVALARQVGIDFGDGFGFVLPGGAINCRCGCRTLIPSLGRGLSSGRNFDPDKLVAVPGFPGAYKMAA